MQHRRGLVAGIVTLLVGMALLAGVAGCGNSGVQQYTTQVGSTIFALNNAEGEIKKPWGLPLAQQGNAPEAVAAFRKELESAQEKLDATDAPQVCRKLDNTLRDIVDQGRVMADIATGYSDYVGDMSSFATQMDTLVATLQTLSEANDIPSGLAGLVTTAEKIEREAKAVVPPSVFNGFHQEIVGYMSELVSTLYDAKKVLGEEKQQPVDIDEENTTPEDEEEGTAPDARTEEQNRAIEPLLEDIPDDWARFNGQMNSMLDTVRGVIGLNAKIAEIEGLIGQAVTEIQSLEKQYK
ncbi:MAG: hypothetical protein V1748_08175 [Actinomycetota bacterium]